MSTTILGFLVALQFAVVTAVPGWNSDYAQALDVARQQQRPLVVVLEDSSRRQQTASILANPVVRMTLRECSVCRVDVGTRRGAAVADRLNATSFPYTVISDRSARHIVFRGSAELSDEEWLTLLSDAIGEPDSKGTAKPPRPDRSIQNDLRVVVLSTNGCAYCERLKIETMPSAMVNRVLDRGMTVEHVNASDDDTLARQHGVTIYPSILVLDDGDRLVDRIDGFLGPDELAARLQACEHSGTLAE